MSLLSLLSTSSQSMLAHRGASATAQNNLQNVNTPGFSRQRANLVAATASPLSGALIGRGANLQSISQARDRFLEARVPATFASERRAAAEADVLTSVSAFDLDSSNGVAPALSRFYGSLRALSLNPEDGGSRRAVVGAAKELQQAMRRTADELAAARRGVDESLPSQVDEVNQLAREVAKLNKTIQVESSSGQAPNDLIDARRRAADRLAELTGAAPVADANGNLNLLLSDGSGVVVGEIANEMATEPDPANGGLLRITLSGRPLRSTSLSGSIGGNLAARDGTLKAAEDGLDQFAFDLASSLNTVHQAGVGLDGSTGRALFDVGAAAAGAAQRFTLNAALEADPRALAAASTGAGLPGNSDNARALLATENALLSSGETPAGSFATVVARFGTEAKRAVAVAAQEDTLRARLEDLRASASSVSIDEEMVEMTKAQRAFEATSKVIQTIDQMLDTVIKLR